MPENQNADVEPKDAGERKTTIPRDSDTASVGVRPPNEKGLDREANDATGEPAIEPADEVSEGR